MSTKVWISGGTGDWFAGGNWTGGAPGAGDIGVITDGTITLSDITLSDAHLLVRPPDGYPINPTLVLSGATLAASTTIETQQAAQFDNWTSFDVVGSAEIDGTILANQTIGIDQFGSGTGALTIGASGLIEINGGPDLFFSLDSLVNNGTVQGGPNYSSMLAPVTGHGQFITEPNGTMEFDQPVDAGIHVVFAAGATDATLSVFDPAAFHASVTGFAETDTIEMNLPTADAAVLSNGTLTVSAHGTTLASFPVSGPAGSVFIDHLVGGFTDPNDVYIHAGVACYVSGTRIATETGAAAVETLRIGDVVRLADGACQTVRWAGQFSVDLTRHPNPDSAAPVLIRQGAIARNLPARDLLVSPDHAVLVDGALLPAHALVNGATIARDRSFRGVTYHHIELDRHALLLAEGLPAESYLDTGNRAQFDAEPGVRPLFPDLTQTGAGARCQELVLDAARIAPIHRRLAARARRMGWRLERDPALRLFADGWGVTLTRISSTDWRAILPPGTSRIRLASRSFVPHDHAPGSPDRRVLGVAVAELALNGRPLPLLDGWHAPEAAWTWTDGNAIAEAGSGVLAITCADAGPGYWVAPARVDAKKLRARG